LKEEPEQQEEDAELEPPEGEPLPPEVPDDLLDQKPFDPAGR
jgi:hypothetical protein